MSITEITKAWMMVASFAQHHMGCGIRDRNPVCDCGLFAAQEKLEAALSTAERASDEGAVAEIVYAGMGPIGPRRIEALVNLKQFEAGTKLYTHPPQATVRPVREWQPIETAPRDGRTLLLGYFNQLDRWRTLRGQWFSREVIDEEWENGDECSEGWYESSVECDADISCWRTFPTHWMLLPAPPNGFAQEPSP